MVLKQTEILIQSIVSETLRRVCSKYLSYKIEISIEGILHIVLDKKDAVLINIKETVDKTKQCKQQVRNGKSTEHGGTASGMSVVMASSTSDMAPRRSQRVRKPSSRLICMGLPLKDNMGENSQQAGNQEDTNTDWVTSIVVAGAECRNEHPVDDASKVKTLNADNITLCPTAKEELLEGNSRRPVEELKAQLAISGASHALTEWVEAKYETQEVGTELKEADRISSGVLNVNQNQLEVNILQEQIGTKTDESTAPGLQEQKAFLQKKGVSYKTVKKAICTGTFIGPQTSRRVKVNTRNEVSGWRNCPVCKKRCKNYRYLQLHVAVCHTESYTSKCGTCMLKFATPADLHRHQKAHPTYICDICGRVLKKRINLELHRKIHMGVKPFQCETCEQRFRSKYKLKYHARVHTEEKPYTCALCDESFAKRISLRKHTYVHSGKKLYKCNACEKEFMNSKSLIVHRRVHTGEKPYMCNECGRQFADKKYLKFHKMTHSGVKPFQCQQCGAVFSRSFGLNKHVKNIHADDVARPHKCDHCDMTFKFKAAKVRHEVAFHTGGKYKCSHCEQKFNMLRDKKQHMLMHGGTPLYQCQYCKKEFKQKKHLINHVHTHTGEKPHECDVCQKRFRQKATLSVHRKLHTGEKLFMCENCGMSFIQSGNMKRHQCKAQCQQNSHGRAMGEGMADGMVECAEVGAEFGLEQVSGNVYVCELCQQRFDNLDVVKNHITLDHPEVLTECLDN